MTAATCIKWAYGVQDSQISGPEWLQSEHFDILAKADDPVAEDHLKLMMRSLLAERFKLTFHRQSKELSAYAMTIAKGGHKLKESDSDGKPYRQNSAIGTVAKAMTMRDFADFISGHLRMPVVVVVGEIITATQGEQGLRLESRCCRKTDGCEADTARVSGSCGRGCGRRRFCPSFASHDAGELRDTCACLRLPGG